MRITSAMLRLKKLFLVQLFTATTFILVAVIAREIVLAVTRAVTKIKDAPQVWFAPKGATSYGPSGAMYAVWAAIVTVSFGYLAYCLYVRVIEARPVHELGYRGSVKELAIGIGIGFAMVSAVVLILLLLGHFTIDAVNQWWWAVAALATAATAAFMEELFFRGVVFRLVEQGIGSWPAVGLSAAIFGYAHARNPAATASSIVTVALSAGVILGFAFILTRRLWLPIGIHFGVNATQGALFGVAVSGESTRGVFMSHLQGSPLLTGGPFGLEASVLVLIASAIVATVFIRVATKREHLLKFRTARASAA